MQLGAAEGRVAFLRKLGLDAVVLDQEGRLLAPRAEVPLPYPFIWSGSRVVLTSPAEHGDLAHSLAGLAHHPPGWKTLLAVGDVLVVLMKDMLDETEVTLPFVVKRHLESRICPACLRDAFGFSEREAALAALVASGRPLQDAANKLGMSVATARTHLRHIFLKAGIESQNELVALVAASAFGTCDTVCSRQQGDVPSIPRRASLRQLK